jgi:methionyl-tRNA formyltransferase
MVTVIVLGINDIGEQILEWLRGRDDATVQAVIETKDELDRVETLNPELLVSAGFRYIVPEYILEIPDRGAINIHKSYLPYNRGANPNVWSIIEDTPAGVSIHYMTPSVDAGPIIDRRIVSVYPDDNGRDLYERLEAAQYEQFTEIWPAIRDGDAEVTQQESDAGTYHTKDDFVDLWELDPKAETTVEALIDRLRALTFPPYNNAYFEVDGEKYYVEIDITPATETDKDSDSDRSIPEYPDEGFN